MTEDYPQLDVIAVGAHPDDVEIACGGTWAGLARQGYKVGIVDLTDGEPTPRSPSPDVRRAEARRAAETLGAEHRVILDLPNRRLFDDFDARVAFVGAEHLPGKYRGEPFHWSYDYAYTVMTQQLATGQFKSNQLRSSGTASFTEDTRDPYIDHAYAILVLERAMSRSR